MSNAAKLADILKRLGDAHYQAADELIALATEQPGQATGVPVSAQPAPVDDLPPMEPAYNEFPAGHPIQGEGSLAMCPKHKAPYLPSKFKEGTFYCPSDSDDPAWRNSKGKCSINPKNVAVWLRAQAA